MDVTNKEFEILNYSSSENYKKYLNELKNKTKNLHLYSFSISFFLACLLFCSGISFFIKFFTDLNSFVLLLLITLLILLSYTLFLAGFIIYVIWKYFIDFKLQQKNDIKYSIDEVENILKKINNIEE